MTSPDTSAAEVVAWSYTLAGSTYIYPERRHDTIGWIERELVLKSTLDAALARAEGLEADLAAAESDTRDEAYREGYEEGKSEWRGVKAQLWNAMQHWLALRHDLQEDDDGYTVNDLLDGLAEVEAENKRVKELLRKATLRAEAAEARETELERERDESRRMSSAHREHAQTAVENSASLNRLLSIAEARAESAEAELAKLRAQSPLADRPESGEKRGSSEEAGRRQLLDNQEQSK